eukprot:scaffold80_cov382-Prasinococcus_capsulatus_cf.AAC.7
MPVSNLVLPALSWARYDKLYIALRPRLDASRLSPLRSTVSNTKATREHIWRRTETLQKAKSSGPQPSSPHIGVLLFPVLVHERIQALRARAQPEGAAALADAISIARGAQASDRQDARRALRARCFVPKHAREESGPSRRQWPWRRF